MIMAVAWLTMALDLASILLSKVCERDGGRGNGSNSTGTRHVSTQVLIPQSWNFGVRDCSNTQIVLTK